MEQPSCMARELNSILKEQEFNSALPQSSRAYVNKEVQDILNQAAADLGFAAFKTTAMAPANKIKKHAPDRRTYPGRLLYAIQNPNSNQPSSSPKLAPSLKGTKDQNARFLYNRRYGGRKYIGLGWLGALIKMGVNVKTRVSSGLVRSSAGKRATADSPYAVLVNGAYGSSEVGLKPLQRAIFRVAAKKRKFAEKRLNKLAKKYSGK